MTIPTRTRLIALFGAGALTMAGCAGNSQEQNTGAGIGAGVGALLGAGLGVALADDDDERLKYGLIGAGLGAAAGGVAGYAIGTRFTEQRSEYASAEAYYDAQIVSAQSFNSELLTETSNLQSQVASNEQQISALTYQRGTSTTDLSVEEQLLSSAQANQQRAEGSVAAAQDNLTRLNAIRNEAYAEEGAASARVAQLDSQIQQANQQVAQLEAVRERSRTNVRTLTARRSAGGAGIFN